MSERPLQRFINELLDRIEREWVGSDLELEIRSGLPGKFLRKAREDGMQGTGWAENACHWLRLRRFLETCPPRP